MKTIGDRFKGIRVELNISQKAFAQLLNSEQSTVSKIENGVFKPTTEILNELYNKFSIARNIGVSKDDIRSALGHGDNSVTDIYIDLDRDLIDEIIKKPANS